MPRTALVTGAGSGIGQNCAELLQSQGYEVIGVDLHGADIDADLRDPASIKAMVDAVEQHHTSIDALVANAGVSTSSPLDLEVNYYGAIDSITALLPLLQRSASPRVAITASAASLQRTDAELVDALLHGTREEALDYGAKLQQEGKAAGYGNYSASKRAVVTWMRQVAITEAFAGHGIAINAVAPGVVKTPMTEQLLATKEGAEMAFGAMPAPLNGAAEPSAIAAVLAFLVSEANASMTGQVLYVDGGFDCSTPQGRGADIWHDPKHLDA